MLLGSHGDVQPQGDVLLIVDSLQSLPPTPSLLYQLIASNTSHVIITMETKYFGTDDLKKKIEHELIRGTCEVVLDPLTELHVTQRLVHGVMSRSEFTPYNKEQDILSCIAERSLGSPDLVDVIGSLLDKYADAAELNSSEEGFLDTFKSDICNVLCSRQCSISYSTSSSLEEEKEGVSSMDSKQLEQTSEDVDRSRLIEGDFISHLINNFHLSKSEFLMLACVSLFDGAPLPVQLLQQIQTLLQDACPEESQSPLEKLMSYNFLHHHPTPVIATPHSLRSPQVINSSSFYHVPLVISQTVCESLSGEDLVMSLSLACSSLVKLTTSVLPDNTIKCWLSGLLQCILKEARKVEDIYGTLYRMYLTFNN